MGEEDEKNAERDEGERDQTAWLEAPAEELNHLVIERERPQACVMGAEDEGVLRLEVDGEWNVGELSAFLGQLRSAYASVRFFEHAFETEAEYRPRFRHLDWPGPVLIADPMGLHRGVAPLSDVSSVLKLDGEPRLVSIHIASPGWVEVLAKLNPLVAILDFVKWVKNQDLRREKLKGELVHQNLENHLLANEVVKQRVDLLRGLGYSRKQIQEVMSEYLAKPLESLRPMAEGKIINGSVKVVAAPKTKELPENTSDGDEEKEKKKPKKS